VITLFLLLASQVSPEVSPEPLSWDATLAPRLRAATEEQRAQIAASLSDRAHLLPLILDLAHDPDRRVARPAAEALQALCRKSTATTRDLVSAEAVEWLARNAGEPVRLVGPVLQAPAAEVVDVLRRAGGAPVRLVVDPEASERLVPVPAGAGDLLRWLAALQTLRKVRSEVFVDANEVGCVVLGLPPSEGLSSALDAASEAPAERWARWRERWLRLAYQRHDPSTAPEGPTDPAVRRRAACALAMSGWDLGLEWLAHAARQGDAVAVEALCWAVGDTHGGRELAQPAVQTQLIALRDQLLARAEWTPEDASRCARLTRGLAAALALQPQAAQAHMAAMPEQRTPHALLMYLELLRQVALRLEHSVASPTSSSTQPSLPPAIAAVWAMPASEARADHELLLAAWRAAAAMGLRADESVLQRHGVQLAQALRGARLDALARELARQVGLLPSVVGLEPHYEVGLHLAAGRADLAQVVLGRLTPVRACVVLHRLSQELDAGGMTLIHALQSQPSWWPEPAARDPWQRLHSPHVWALEDLQSLATEREAWAVLAGRPAQTVVRQALLDEWTRQPSPLLARSVCTDLEAAGRPDLADAFAAGLGRGGVAPVATEIQGCAVDGVRGRMLPR